MPTKIKLKSPNGKCAYCEGEFGKVIKGREGTRLLKKTKDHIIPLDKVGKLSVVTIEVCDKCNSSKSNLWPSEFIEALDRAIAQNNRYRGIPAKLVPIVRKNMEQYLHWETILKPKNKKS